MDRMLLTIFFFECIITQKCLNCNNCTSNNNLMGRDCFEEKGDAADFEDGLCEPYAVQKIRRDDGGGGAFQRNADDFGLSARKGKLHPKGVGGAAPHEPRLGDQRAQHDGVLRVYRKNADRK